MFTESEGIEGYLQHYDLGTNVLAIIPGGAANLVATLSSVEFDPFISDG